MIQAAMVLALLVLSSPATAQGESELLPWGCEALESAVQEALGVPVALAEVPFSDYVTEMKGAACELRADGTGEDFAHFAEAAGALQRLLEEQGWRSDTRYAADGPTGTVIGLRQGDRVAVASVSWELADPALCPEDQPIFLCEVALWEQLYTVTLTLAREAQPAATGLERLALRLLGPWGDLGQITTELEPGRLPDDLPLELPLTGEMELLGSLVRRGEDGQLLNVQVVLDAAMTTDEAMSFLEARLLEEGWTGRREPQQGGFVPLQPNLSGTFCAPENEAFVYVSSFFVRGGPTDVRLDLNQIDYTPCPGIAETPYDPYAGQAPLPVLSAPEESELSFYPALIDQEQALSSARIAVPLSGESLLRHYEAQLTAAGWERLAGEAVGPVGHSRWTLQDEEERSWLATLTITTVAEGEFVASFAVIPSPE